MFVGAPAVPVADVGEPLDLGQHVGELVELGGGQQSRNTGGVDFGRKLVGSHVKGTCTDLDDMANFFCD
jgi:hypothetical protein